MISLEYYRIFFYVAQYKSFTRAAEVLHNAQPNITRYINILESDLGCKLFVRSNRGVTLTPEGETLFDQVSIAMEHLMLGESRLRHEQDPASSLISISVSETAMRLFLLPKLETYQLKYPHVRLKILHQTTPQAINAVRNHLVDLAFVSSPAEVEKPLEKHAIEKFREILICGSRYKDLASKKLPLSAVNEYPFISLEKQTSTRALYSKYFLNHGMLFNPDIEVATLDQVLPMIEHNLGMGFYPEELARESIASGKIYQIPIREALPKREICLITEHGRPLGASAQSLMSHVMDQI